MAKILNQFVAFIFKEKQKNRFLIMVKNSWLYKIFINKYWYKILNLNYVLFMRSSHKQNSFYIENSERINQITKLLSDEISKKTYLGMIKFRQTFEKKDFPSSLYEKKHYFIKELILDEEEVFIDCGAYDGDTIREFLKHCPNYKQIIAFEPQEKTFKILSEKYENNPKITLINAGVFDEDGEISFKGENLNPAARIEFKPDAKTDNSAVVKTKTIDGLNLQNVSFIKMDIEGAELNALKGAEKTILRDKPKLAICIYHSDDDMIRIAEYIHELLPEYKLYVRQHEKYPILWETVLYALP